MPNLNKYPSIEKYFCRPLKDLLHSWYVVDQLSALAIRDKIFHEANIPISARAIDFKIKEFGFSRSRSQARYIGIKTGRVDYSKLRKPIKSSENRKGISLKIRNEIFKRDNFRCVICGHTANDMRQIVDHIKPAVSGGTNETSNLRTLCVACNHGKMLYENEK